MWNFSVTYGGKTEGHLKVRSNKRIDISHLTEKKVECKPSADNNGFRLLLKETTYTAQKMKFSIKDFFNKYDQILMKLQIWSHLLKKSLMENFIFCAVLISRISRDSPVLNKNIASIPLLSFD